MYGFKKRIIPQHSTHLYLMEYCNIIKTITQVFLMMLDCSNALDRVHCVKLFKLLYQKCLCPVTIRLLLFMYLNQSLCGSWGNSMSSEFLAKLKLSGLGCNIGDTFLGTLCY